MLSKIRVLSDHLANQIAAGEVVERPASVAKELVENSIDAGARRIIVEAEAGGRRLLRVTDDGEGLTRDDALLAFERHATSKIRAAEDLQRISTLGFRGEALASIASVARVELVTQIENETEGTRVVIEGGRMRDVQPAAAPRGTRLTVRDLFFNVPARRKFLRSEATETFHLTNLVTHYALAHPEIAFTLTNNGRETLRAAPAADLRERAYQVFGAEFIENLLEVNGGIEQTARVRGFISAPRERRTSRDAQYLFVNGRYVRDRLVSRALSEGYRSVLPPGVYPAALLFLEIPLEEVDVNVHPAKIEVRFRRAAAVADIVREAVRAALARNGYDSRAHESSQIVSPEDFDETEAREFNANENKRELYAADANAPSPSLHDNARLQMAQEKIDFQEAANEVSPFDETLREFDAASFDAAQDFARQALTRNANVESRASELSLKNQLNDAPRDVSHLPSAQSDKEAANDETERKLNDEKFEAANFSSSQKNCAPLAPSTSSSQNLPNSSTQNSKVENSLRPQLAPMNAALPPFDNAIRLIREVAVEQLTANIRPLGQLENSFIIATDNDGLLLIDQHVAHERILFDKYRRLEENRRAESQQMLVPETFDLTPAQAVAFDKIANELEFYGFNLMRLSGRTVAVKSVPADLPPSEARNLLAEILDTVEAERRGAPLATLRDRIAASLACRAAVKINMPLTTEKMQWLIDRLLHTSSPTTCPHGRPVVLRIFTRDLLKGFHRT